MGSLASDRKDSALLREAGENGFSVLCQIQTREMLKDTTSINIGADALMVKIPYSIEDG